MLPYLDHIALRVDEWGDVDLGWGRDGQVRREGELKQPSGAHAFIKRNRMRTCPLKSGGGVKDLVL